MDTTRTPWTRPVAVRARVRTDRSTRKNASAWLSGHVASVGGGAALEASDTREDPVRDVIETFRGAVAEPPGSLGAYVISIAREPSDVPALKLLQAARSLTPSSFAPGARGDTPYQRGERGAVWTEDPRPGDLRGVRRARQPELEGRLIHPPTPLRR